MELIGNTLKKSKLSCTHCSRFSRNFGFAEVTFTRQCTQKSKLSCTHCSRFS